MVNSLIKKICAGLLAMIVAPAVMAFGGTSASGVEPGAGCEAKTGFIYKRATGAPYEGSAVGIYNASGLTQVTVSATLEQYGADCTVQVTAVVSEEDGITPEEFTSFKGNEISGVCLTVVSQSPEGCAGTDLMEALAGRKPTFEGNVVTIPFMAYPLAIQQ